ncbi:hypothetical protein J6590_016203 [Homalodisca vitripennis]|nr:hypothetical protein J6590_016203 [Homalodisca vitripennis]
MEFTTVDEQLVVFRRGWLMTSKPAKYGSKIFTLANAEVYVSTQPRNRSFPQCNMPHDVVLRLVTPIEKTKCNMLQEQPPSPPRSRQRCIMCPRPKDIKTMSKCGKCYKPMCLTHMRSFCETCQKN